MTRLRRFLLSSRSSKGAVAVEFALIFPVFIFMIFAMFDMGRFLIVQMSMNSAAHAGARAASMSATASTISQITTSSSTDAIVRLSTLGDQGVLDITGITPEAYACPINIENVNDASCSLLNDTVRCNTQPSNYAVIAKASVTFKWLTPLQWLLTYSTPDNPPDNVWVNRGLNDTVTVQGRAKVLCQN
jgi:Flp pilus assembly protein TadG